MIISQCCGAKLDPMWPNDEICDKCKEHCSTTTDEERAIEDGEQEIDQFADSE